jgi:hypothetical protein
MMYFPFQTVWFSIMMSDGTLAFLANHMEGLRFGDLKQLSTTPYMFPVVVSNVTIQASE